MQMPFSRPGFALVPVTSPMRMSAQRGNALRQKRRGTSAVHPSRQRARRVDLCWRAVGRDSAAGTLLPPACAAGSGRRVAAGVCAPGARAACSTSVLSRASPPFGGGSSIARRAFWRPIGPNTADPRHRVQTSHTPEDGGLPNCYFCDPGELPALFADAGLAVEHVCATEVPDLEGKSVRFPCIGKTRSRGIGCNSFCTIARSQLWCGLRSTSWS